MFDTRDRRKKKAPPSQEKANVSHDYTVNLNSNVNVALISCTDKKGRQIDEALENSTEGISRQWRECVRERGSNKMCPNRRNVPHFFPQRNKKKQANDRKINLK